MKPETFDRWRVMPRLLIALYGVACTYVLIWYTGLDAPTGSQTTFATGIWGAGSVWFGFYVNSGKKSDR